MSAFQLPLWTYPTVVIGAGLAALWRGREEERLGAFTMLAAWAVTMVVYRTGSRDTQWGIFAVDTVQFVVFVWLSMKTRRYWPLFAAGFGLLQVVTHGAKTLDTGISAWAYITAQIIWSYLILFTIIYASLSAPRRYAEIEAMPAIDPPGATRR
ncbi:MAG: hypothetical protein JNL41_02595 [Phenylobacterium sp.]|uniref:hypothetical protein n=1 Tax=Phenylobacterium sp. TaxID=1871053 RepID=UPI001A389BBD|nr:hypothetical protein [Phenylobacterium sp.]MBL8553141.1 hypothetical protein [Phenylobacterium sp.]